MKTIVFAFAAVFAIVNAACNRVDVNVANGAEFQQAIGTAQPGWNIILAKGEYSVWKEFEMRSDGTADCPIIITCQNPGDAVLVSPLYLFGADHVRVSNIVSSAPNFELSFELEEVTDVVIENIRVTNCQEDGFFFEESKDVTIRNCTFDNIAGYAIVFDDMHQSTIEHCVFGDKIGYYDGDCAIWVRSGSSSNKIYDNSFATSSSDISSWISIGYECEQCTGNEIARNVFRSPDGRTMKDGIQCMSGNNNIFKENNMVFNATGYGFHVMESKQIICASNKVEGCQFTDGTIDQSC